MKLKVLFWNYDVTKADALLSAGHDEARATVLGRACEEHQVDILALAECRLPPERVLKALRQYEPRFFLPANPHDRFQFFTRFPGEFLEAQESDDRIAIRRLALPGCRDILLAAIHYYDRRNHSKEKQHRAWPPHRETLRAAERQVEHARTVLFGDFNMNPFDIGMVDPVAGVGAMMTRDLARRHSEIKGHFCFYNPMWSRMGRESAPGTYYWDGDEPANPYWNCLDGVLVRPGLLDAVGEDDVRIIRGLRGLGGEMEDMVRPRAFHWSIAHSDHLPILISISLPES